MRWKILWDKKKLSKWINEKKKKIEGLEKIYANYHHHHQKPNSKHTHGQPSVGVWQNPKKKREKEKKIHSTDGKNEIRLQFFFIWKHIVLAEKKNKVK